MEQMQASHRADVGLKRACSCQASILLLTCKAIDSRFRSLCTYFGNSVFQIPFPSSLYTQVYVLFVRPIYRLSPIFHTNFPIDPSQSLCILLARLSPFNYDNLHWFVSLFRIRISGDFPCTPTQFSLDSPNSDRLL